MTDGWYELDDWYAPLNSDDFSNENYAVKEKTRKKSRIIGVAVTAAVLAAAILFLIFNPSININPHYSPENGGDLPKDFKDFFDSYYTSTDTEKSEIFIQKAEKQDLVLSVNNAAEPELTLSELYSKCAPSIVAIKAFDDNKDDGYSWGSGIIVSSDGIIVTNTHVVDNSSSVSVVLSDDSEFDAKLIGADAICDIAVLKIDKNGLCSAEFADSDAISVGEHVAAIGNPLGDVFRLTMTDGIISAIERNMQYRGHTMTLVQTNTALNEGNSGGALFNMSGQVVGITNMKMMSSYSSIEGIGFAIPSKTAVSVINELISSGTIQGRTSIGITVGAIPENISKAYDLPMGLYVNEVAKGSDAEKKGIIEGDVVTAINSVPVTSLEDVNEIKDGLKVGDVIKISYFRNGQNYEADVMLMDTNEIYG